MSLEEATNILAAEIDEARTRRLLLSLAPLGRRVLVATTPEMVVALLRREAFQAAAVAVELTLNGTPLLAHLTQLPSLLHSIAIGPAGNRSLEMRARICGAQVYLTRPVSAAILAAALKGSRLNHGLAGLWWPARITAGPHAAFRRLTKGEHHSLGSSSDFSTE